MKTIALILALLTLVLGCAKSPTPVERRVAELERQMDNQIEINKLTQQHYEASSERFLAIVGMVKTNLHESEQIREATLNLITEHLADTNAHGGQRVRYVAAPPGMKFATTASTSPSLTRLNAPVDEAHIGVP